MKKSFLFVFSFFIASIIIMIGMPNVYADSYLSDKTEMEIDLDVPGVEAICQTDDGYIWIAQYSGLIRYDSKEQITYKYFEENGIKHETINVRALKQLNNELFIMTKTDLYKYADNKFQTVNFDLDSFKKIVGADSNRSVELLELELDSYNSLLYVSSDIGLIKYDIKNNQSSFIEETKDKKVNDCATYKDGSIVFYVLEDGIYSNGTLIHSDTTILDIYVYDNNLLIGNTTGFKKRNILSGDETDYKTDIPTGQVNKFLYSESNKILFVASDKKGLYCVDTEDYSYTIADSLANKDKLVDILVDYENNLWVASHSVSASGLSLITKNALFNLLYDDTYWAKKISNKQVNAIKRYENYILIASNSHGILSYDLNQKKIVDSDITTAVMSKINEYVENLGEEVSPAYCDIEIYNNDLYFAVYGIGLVKYDTSTKEVTIYGKAFVEDDNNFVEINADGTNSLVSRARLLDLRCLKAFDGYLIIGYQNGGIIKFEDSKYTVFNVGKTVLNIHKALNGNILFVYTKKIYEITKDLKNPVEIETEANVDGNKLTLLVDDNKIYYNLNSRLFCYEKNGDTISNREIVLPGIKGSIFEIKKVKIEENSGNISYKFIIVSQNQIFITESLDKEYLDEDNKLKNFDVYDSSNGIKSIYNNTFGYYDENTLKYYLQTTDGIFVYDFNELEEDIPALKTAINSIDIDGTNYYTDNVTVDKNAYRIVFNISVLGYRPNKGYSLYYKLDGVDSDYIQVFNGNSVSYTNLNGGNYTFHSYVLDEYGQKSNEITINIIKPKKFFEEPGFWVILGILLIIAILVFNYFIIRRRTKKAIERQNEYKAITLESIEAIARTIDAKDSYTNGHSKRVGIYSREIARALKLPDDEIDNIYYIALLHDIGKISIPLEILNKPGRLTDEEFEIMKSHTTAGAKILDGITTIPHIVEGAKYHHERFGGGGYPTGISGEEIPFIARIICCADCYDAMATKRTYKEPYTKEKIISEFERCKGSQFDPKIADIVIKLIKEDRLRYGTELKSESKEKN
ncbi:MAG: HD domain-containing protein [Acholeplasmatales bacterium]|nr:HD domain-containing protein [Acholeplasmatales bacterium]